MKRANKESNQPKKTTFVKQETRALSLLTDKYK